jgi:hypothetical protein
MTFRPALIASAAVLLAGSLALSSVVSTTAPARAEGGHSFIVPANDGYDLAECLAQGAACGKVVADAWCEAQGYGKSEGFGPSDPAETTASIAVKAGAPATPKTYTISCHD